MSKLPVKVNSAVSFAQNNPMLIAEGAKTVLMAALEYKKIKEEEATKRENIRSVANVRIEEIRANKEIFLYYLENNYKERAIVYKELFDRLDQGIEKGDSKLVEMAMGGIITQIQKNPFESFSDFKKNLHDSNYVEEF